MYEIYSVVVLGSLLERYLINTVDQPTRCLVVIVLLISSMAGLVYAPPSSGSSSRASQSGEVGSDGSTKTCGMCLRTDKHPNPMPKKLPGTLLQFVSGHILRCVSCKNYLRSICSNSSPKEMQDSMAQDPDKRVDYLACVNKYDEEANNTVGYLTSVKDKIPRPSFVNIVEEQGKQDTMNLGVFWPNNVGLAEEAEAFP